MKAVLVLAVLGAFGVMLQSSAALWVPARALPDLGLLVVVALAVSIRSPVLGVCLAVGLGYVTDLLSGAMLGQHALLRLGAYGVARVLSSSVNLRGPFSLALFTLVLAATQAFVLHAISAFFARSWSVTATALEDVAVHALATAIAAPMVVGLVSRAAARLGDDDSGRPVHLEARAFSL